MATIEPYDTKAGRRYMVRYRTPDQVQTKKRGFKTKRDATIFANTVEVKKLTGDYIAPSDGRVPLATVATAWFTRQLHVKPSWAARQESIYRVHIEPKWGARHVATIDRPAIQDWIASLDKAPSTVADIHNVLAGILDGAVDERRIPANPARGVNLPRRTLVEHSYLDHAQVLQLIGEVTHPAIVSLLAYAGPRWGEMAALRPMDVDLDRGRIHIRRSASKVNTRSDIVAPKTWE